MNSGGIQIKKLMVISTLALLALQAATPAQAVLILINGPYVFSGSASVTDTNATTGATTNNGASMGSNVLIPQFDAAQGVLISASYQLSSSRTVTLSGNGSGSGTATGSSASATAKLAAPGMSVTLGTVTSPNASCSSTSPCSYSSSSAVVASNGSYGVASSSLDSYVGGGTVTASRSAPTLSVTSGGTKPSTSATATESWSGTLSTSYSYMLHAAPSFDGGLFSSVLTLDFGSVMLNSTVDPLLFSIFNLIDPNRVALDLDAIVGSGDIATLTTDISPFMNLMPGSLFDFSAFIDTAVLGSFNATYLLMFSDEDVGAATSRHNNLMLTLNLMGNVAPAPALASVPEPGSLALLGAGVLGLVWRRRVRRSAALA